MANYINQIQLGTQVYKIGMQNALHFEGLALIGTWFEDSTCKTAATTTSLTSKDFLYYNGSSIDSKTVEIGCVYLPATGTTEAKVATNYELVCVEIGTGNVSKWAVLGEVTSKTGTAIVSVSTKSLTYATGAATVATASFVNSVTPATKTLTYASSVNTASINALGTVGTAAVADATVVTNVSATTASISYGSSISKGAASGTLNTGTIAATVSGGSVTAKTATPSVTVASGKAIATIPSAGVAATLTNDSKKLVTGITNTAASGATSNFSVSGTTLVIPTIGYVTSVSGGTASANTSDVNIPTGATVKGVLTGLTYSDITANLSTAVVTSVSHTNPAVAIPTGKVVTAVAYTAPTLTTTSQTIVSAVSANTMSAGTVDAAVSAVVTSVAADAKTVATGVATTSQTIVSGVTAGKADAATGVTLTTATQTVVTDATTGTVVTSVL